LDLKNSKRLRNTFREDVNNLVQRRRRETLSWPSKIAEGLLLSGDAALASARICLTHEEGLSLSDDAALALVRICLTPRSRRGNLEQGTKTMLKPKESPHWAKEPILARRAAGRVATLGRRSQFWREGRRQLGWRRCQCGAQIPKVNLCRRSMGLLRFCIFSKRNADEDPKIRVFVKDEG